MEQLEISASKLCRCISFCFLHIQMNSRVKRLMSIARKPSTYRCRYCNYRSTIQELTSTHELVRHKQSRGPQTQATPPRMGTYKKRLTTPDFMVRKPTRPAQLPHRRRAVIMTPSPIINAPAVISPLASPLVTSPVNDEPPAAAEPTQATGSRVIIISDEELEQPGVDGDGEEIEIFYQDAECQTTETYDRAEELFQRCVTGLDKETKNVQTFTICLKRACSTHAIPMHKSCSNVRFIYHICIDHLESYCNATEYNM